MYRGLGEKTFEQLSDGELHWSPNETSNSIAAIILHLHGNMLSRWTNFLTEDGEKPWRAREEEFTPAGQSRDELMSLWAAGWDCLLDALKALTPADLQKTITIRGEPLPVVDAINRQLAHYPYHVGQIIYIGKMLRGEEWKSLSIGRGQTAAFNEHMRHTFGGKR